jgi:DNA-binding NarL/FixJ family response regulator
MLENGASGYLLKDADRHEIINGIQSVASGKTFLSHSAALALRKPERSSLPPLTRRERDVLELIADGLTNKQIASKLFVDVTTVDSHRKNMLAKYGVSNTSALIKLAICEHLIE